MKKKLTLISAIIVSSFLMIVFSYSIFKNYQAQKLIDNQLNLIEEKAKNIEEQSKNLTIHYRELTAILKDKNGPLPSGKEKIKGLEIMKAFTINVYEVMECHTKSNQIAEILETKKLNEDQTTRLQKLMKTIEINVHEAPSRERLLQLLIKGNEILGFTEISPEQEK